MLKRIPLMLNPSGVRCGAHPDPSDPHVATDGDRHQARTSLACASVGFKQNSGFATRNTDELDAPNERHARCLRTYVLGSPLAGAFHGLQQCSGRRWSPVCGCSGWMDTALAQAPGGWLHTGWSLPAACLPACLAHCLAGSLGVSHCRCGAAGCSCCSSVAGRVDDFVEFVHCSPFLILQGSTK